MKRTKYYVTPVLLLFCINLYGQYFKKLDMKDGLSNLSVLAIYQDTLGRMWFGTNEGLISMMANGSLHINLMKS